MERERRRRRQGSLPPKRLRTIGLHQSIPKRMKKKKKKKPGHHRTMDAAEGRTEKRPQSRARRARTRTKLEQTATQDVCKFMLLSSVTK